MSLYYSILNSCCTVGKRNSRVRIDEDAHAAMWTSVENRNRGYGCVVGTDRRGHKSRMRVERCNRFKAFLPEALHEIVGIAEPLFIHFSVPSWGISRDRPTNYRGRGRPRHTVWFRKIPLPFPISPARFSIRRSLCARLLLRPRHA